VSDRPRAAPFVLPRALIFLSSVWLIGSWLLAIGLVPPIHPSSTSYEHGLQMMLLCVTSGLMIGWPLFRLSQSAAGAPLRQTGLDLLVMASMLQVILWPLRLVTSWSLLRTLAIDLTLIGWLVLAGAIVAAAIGTDRPGPRILAMLGCLAMCLLGPALAVFASQPASLDAHRLSPFLAVRALGYGGGAPVEAAGWAWIGVLVVAAVAGWAFLALLATIRARRGAG
jgi:hypothetical protein